MATEAARIWFRLPRSTVEAVPKVYLGLQTHSQLGHNSDVVLLRPAHDVLPQRRPCPFAMERIGSECLRCEAMSF